MTSKAQEDQPVAQPLAIKLLTAAQILGADDYQFRDVPCPEWGGTVRIRNLTGAGRGIFIKRNMAARSAQQDYDKACAAAKAAGQPQPPDTTIDFEAEAVLVAMTAVDDTGSPIFTEKQVEALKLKSAAPLTRCADAAQDLAGMTAAAQEKAVKNSEATPS